MPYSAEISRGNPGCLIFLLDQSGSMYGDFGGGKGSQSKAQALSDAINRLLAETILSCTRTEGVRDYFYVAVLGYEGAQVFSAFSGTLANQELFPLSVIALNPLREEDRQMKMRGDGPNATVTKTVKMPIWIEPRAGGGTPMCLALNRAHQIADDWIRNRPSAFPPIVIHISDGGSTDGDPIPPAQQLMNLATSDGNLLVFNCHISGVKGKPTLYPSTEAELSDNHARRLFHMSSILPPSIAAEFQKEGYKIHPDSRGMVFNGDMVEMIQFLNVGTRSVRNLR